MEEVAEIEEGDKMIELATFVGNLGIYLRIAPKIMVVAVEVGEDKVVEAAVVIEEMAAVVVIEVEVVVIEVAVVVIEEAVEVVTEVVEEETNGEN